MPTPDEIHELILEDRRISAVFIHEDLDMRKLSKKWLPKRLNADQKRQRCQLSEQHLEFFRRDPNGFLSGAIGDYGRNLVISL